MKRIALALIVGCGLLLQSAAEAWAQPVAPPAENPAHKELRQLRSDLVEAIDKGDADAMLAKMSPDILLTWLNGEQSHGTKQVREYYDRMMKGDKPVVKSYKIEDVKVNDLTQLYGADSGMAYGTAKSHFVLTDGREFTVEGPWTAVVVRDGGKWSLAALHTSANMFDNPILGIVTTWLYRAAIGAGVAGLLLGMLVMAIIKRKRGPIAPAQSV